MHCSTQLVLPELFSLGPDEQTLLAMKTIAVSLHRGLEFESTKNANCLKTTPQAAVSREYLSRIGVVVGTGFHIGLGHWGTVVVRVHVAVTVDWFGFDSFQFFRSLCNNVSENRSGNGTFLISPKLTFRVLPDVFDHAPFRATFPAPSLFAFPILFPSRAPSASSAPN